MKQCGARADILNEILDNIYNCVQIIDVCFGIDEMDIVGVMSTD